MQSVPTVIMLKMKTKIATPPSKKKSMEIRISNEKNYKKEAREKETEKKSSPGLVFIRYSS